MSPLRVTALLLLAFASGAVHAQRPAFVVPPSHDTVLERLPRGYAALEPAPGRTPTRPLNQANALLAAAARTGDARLAARAEAILASLPSQSVEVRKSRAFAAQHRHAFDDATRLLSSALAERPRDGGARLSRAQILLVQGRLREARSDCTTLMLGIDSEAGTLCIAALLGRQGRYAEANGLLDRWLAQPGREVQAMRSVLVSRGEFAARAGDVEADTWFRRALALDPMDVRTLAAQARSLRAQGLDAQALKLLAHAPRTDGLQLQKTLAAVAVHSPDAPRLAASMHRRYSLARAVGAVPELRDEAELALATDADHTRALALAQENFASQRDFEDVDVLLRAARAARRPDIVANTIAWLRQSGIHAQPGTTR